MTTRADRLRAAIEAYGEATAMVRYVDASNERMREEYRCVAADMMAQALAILTEAEVDGDRLQTIADEAFGPFATEPTDALLTLVERGIFEQRKALAEAEKEIERQIARVESMDNTVTAVADVWRGKVAELEAEVKWLRAQLDEYAGSAVASAAMLARAQRKSAEKERDDAVALAKLREEQRANLAWNYTRSEEAHLAKCRENDDLHERLTSACEERAALEKQREVIGAELLTALQARDDARRERDDLKAEVERLRAHLGYTLEAHAKATATLARYEAPGPALLEDDNDLECPLCEQHPALDSEPHDHFQAVDCMRAGAKQQHARCVAVVERVEREERSRWDGVLGGRGESNYLRGVRACLAALKDGAK